LRLGVFCPLTAPPGTTMNPPAPEAVFKKVRLCIMRAILSQTALRPLRGEAIRVPAPVFDTLENVTWNWDYVT